MKYASADSACNPCVRTEGIVKEKGRQQAEGDIHTHRQPCSLAMPPCFIAVAYSAHDSHRADRKERKEEH